MNEKGKYTKCVSKEFKKDISELCADCPLIAEIKNGIVNQIDAQAKEQQDICTREQFEEYIRNEVSNAQDAMKRVWLTEQQNMDYKNDPHRAKRIEIYIWNKERIKALNLVMSSFNGESRGTDSLHDKIQEAFGFMLTVDRRRHKQILKEQDYDKLIRWLQYYFENEFKIPEIESPIEEMNTNRGNVIYTFKLFFTKEYPTMTFPESLFLLIKECFYPLRDDKVSNFKKQTEPQYYQDLISKSK